MKKDDLRIQYMGLGELHRWPRNPKTHAEDVLVQSMERFGFVQPLLVDDGTGRIVAGHGRLEVLEKMKAAGKKPPGRVLAKGGEWYVPVLRGVSFTTEAEAEAYLLADNRISELGGWDDSALSAILVDFAKVDVASLIGTGWTAGEITTMISEKNLADLKVPALALASGNTGSDPRDKKFWVWCECSSEDQMNALVDKFGIKPGVRPINRQLNAETLLSAKV